MFLPSTLLAAREADAAYVFAQYFLAAREADAAYVFAQYFLSSSWFIRKVAGTVGHPVFWKRLHRFQPNFAQW